MVSVRLAIAAGIALAAPIFTNAAVAQVSLAPQAIGPRCDERCLRALADGVIASMVAHDPARAALAPRARYTENAVELRPGDGFWATASRGLGQQAVYVPDPITGQVGVLGTAEENGTPVLVAMRIGTDRGKVAEIETIVVRSTSSLYRPEGLRDPARAFFEAKPQGEQLSREKLVETSNAYFDALEQDTGDVAHFNPQCHRVENGITTAQPNDQPEPAAPLAAAGTPAAPARRILGCKAGIDSKAYSYIGYIGPRRWFAVDPARNLALGIFMFVHPGTEANADVPGATDPVTGAGNRPRRNLRPFNTLIMELFELKNGGIREVLAVGTSLQYKTKDGWTQ